MKNRKFRTVSVVLIMCLLFSLLLAACQQKPSCLKGDDQAWNAWANPFADLAVKDKPFNPAGGSFKIVINRDMWPGLLALLGLDPSKEINFFENWESVIHRVGGLTDQINSQGTPRRSQLFAVFTMDRYCQYILHPLHQPVGLAKQPEPAVQPAAQTNPQAGAQPVPTVQTYPGLQPIPTPVTQPNTGHGSGYDIFDFLNIPKESQPVLIIAGLVVVVFGAWLLLRMRMNR